MQILTGADGGAGEVARNTLTAAPSAWATRRDRTEEMSSGEAHLELHPVSRLAMIERSLTATGDGMAAPLEIKIGHCAHWFNDVDDGGETDAAFLDSRLGKLRIFRPNGTLSRVALLEKRNLARLCDLD